MWFDRAIYAAIFLAVVILAIAAANIIEHHKHKKIDKTRAASAKHAAYKTRELRDNDNLIFQTVQEFQDDLS